MTVLRKEIRTIFTHSSNLSRSKTFCDVKTLTVLLAFKPITQWALLSDTMSFH